MEESKTEQAVLWTVCVSTGGLNNKTKTISHSIRLVWSVRMCVCVPQKQPYRLFEIQSVPSSEGPQQREPTQNPCTLLRVFCKDFLLREKAIHSQITGGTTNAFRVRVT